ncbi:MAG TPA: hypothetical protein VLC49_14680 [Solirubrobacteraceae bacterium]|nr:hypothetical protein [Solirubrobacteraceae bacterium]
MHVTRGDRRCKRQDGCPCSEHASPLGGKGALGPEPKGPGADCVAGQKRETDGFQAALMIVTSRALPNRLGLAERLQRLAAQTCCRGGLRSHQQQLGGDPRRHGACVDGVEARQTLREVASNERASSQFKLDRGRCGRRAQIREQLSGAGKVSLGPHGFATLQEKAPAISEQLRFPERISALA